MNEINKPVTRRQLLQFAGGGLAIAGANLVFPNATASGQPETSIGQEAAGPGSEFSSPLINTLESLHIDVNLEGLPAGWPVTAEQAATAVSAGPSTVTPDKFVSQIQRTARGAKSWNGEWMAEVGYNVRDGVTYNEHYGIHTRQLPNGNLQGLNNFEVGGEIFEQAVPTPVDIRVNQPGIAVAASRGGETGGGDNKPYVTYFATKGAEIPAVEQVSILRPVDTECECTEELAAETRAYRQAVREFIDNPAVRDGWEDNGVHRFRTVQWFNPETKTFEELDGRLIAEMARQDIDMTFIDLLPVGYPISPTAATRMLGLPENLERYLVIDPTTGEWNFEAWNLRQGIAYKDGIGHFDAEGNILVGHDRVVNGDDAIFDFEGAVNPALTVQRMNAPRLDGATLWARLGGNVNPIHWHTWGVGDAIVPEELEENLGIEQAKLIMHGQTEGVCLPQDPTGGFSELAFAREQASLDTIPTAPNVENGTVLYWNGWEHVQAQQ